MATDRYNPERDVSPAFISRVAEWIAASGEVFVMLRYLRAAGAKDYVFCRSADEFAALVDDAPIGTDIEAFRHPQLLIRGRVTTEFIAEILSSIELSSNAVYMVVSLQRQTDSVLSVRGEFGYAADIREALEDMIGHDVAFGTCPEFNAPDSDDLISASKGGIDGPR